MKLKENHLYLIVIVGILMAGGFIMAVILTIGISTWLTIGLIMGFTLSLSGAVYTSSVLSRIDTRKKDIAYTRQKIYFNQIIDHLQKGETGSAEYKYDNFLKDKGLRG